MALLGMALFGGRLGHTEGAAATTRYHFDHFERAMLTVFVLMCGKWYEPMMATVEAARGGSGGSDVGGQAYLFFPIVGVLGAYLFATLLSALVLQLFTLEYFAPPDITAANGANGAPATSGGGTAPAKQRMARVSGYTPSAPWTMPSSEEGPVDADSGAIISERMRPEVRTHTATIRSSRGDQHGSSVVVIMVAVVIVAGVHHPHRPGDTPLL